MVETNMNLVFPRGELVLSKYFPRSLLLAIIKKIVGIYLDMCKVEIFPLYTYTLADFTFFMSSLH
jgi:hypothetical protein